MKRVEILVEESLYEFYRKVGAQAGGLPAERVMADALLKLAGELSLQALEKKRRRTLGTQALGLGITAVLGGAHTFFVGEELQTNVQHISVPSFL